jgi:hypothetical protein
MGSARVPASLNPSRNFRRTRGLLSMLRTYPAFMPCSAASQNWLPICRSPTGVRRGFPGFLPFVSSEAYPGRGNPTASASLIAGLRKYF